MLCVGGVPVGEDVGVDGGAGAMVRGFRGNCTGLPCRQNVLDIYLILYFMNILEVTSWIILTVQTMEHQ